MSISRVRRDRTRYLCQAAMIAALYVTLTWLSAVFGLESRVPQCRLSEALCVLPLFLPAAVPGVSVGCLLANLLFCPTPADLIFGTLATLLGALGARAIGCWRKNSRPMDCLLATCPNALSNTVIIPLILRYGYGMTGSLPLLVVNVGVGELLSCVLLGTVLGTAIPTAVKRRWMGTRTGRVASEGKTENKTNGMED